MTSALFSARYRELLDGCAYRRLQTAVLRITGRDAERYLHGRITQHVKTLPPRRATRSLVLTPQGRVQALFTLLRMGGEFIAYSEEIAAPELSECLLQFKVADDVTVSDLSAETTLFRYVGQRAPELLSSGSVAQTGPILETLETGDDTNAVLERLSDCTLVDVLSLHGNSHVPASAIAMDDIEYEAFRISTGLPRRGHELTEKTLAPELDISRLVAFDKGCYAGQEVVEMATARGRVNRQLVGLEAQGIAGFGTDHELTLEDASPAGRLTSVVCFSDPDLTRALAFVKTSVPADAPLIAHGLRFERRSAFEAGLP